MVYILSKTGYADVKDSVDIVDQDVTITKIMTTVMGVPEFNNKDIKIYPNPSSGIFTLEISNTSNDTYNIKIFDVLGSMVYNNQISGNGNISKQIDISSYAKGMYFVSIESENNFVISRRIIVK